MVLVALSSACAARALVWPDVVEEIAAGLRAPNAITRRAAAERIGGLSPLQAQRVVDQALRDPEPDVRIAAAQAAIRLRIESAVVHSLPWLLERDVRLRVAACEVARAMPSAGALTPLARALGDTESPLVRAAAADALGSFPSADAVPPLLGHLDDASPQVRVQVMRSLGKQRDQRAVVPVVGKAQDSASEVRQAAARALAELDDPRAVQALILLLRDPVLEVRLDAIFALGRLRRDAAAGPLAGLASDKNAAIRAAAIGALGQIPSKEVVVALVALLGQGDDAMPGAERSPLRAALVEIGDAARAEVGQLLDTTTSPSRAASAAWILGALRATADAGRIVASLRRGTLEPTAALPALAATGAVDTVPVILEYLADANVDVRAAAIRAATALLSPTRPDGRAVEPIVAAMRVRGLDVAERGALAGLLGRTGAPRAAEPLIALLSARELSLRAAAVDALAELGPPDSAVAPLADEALLLLLRAPEGDMRRKAATALARAGGSRAEAALLTLMDGGDGVDRAATLVALAGVLSRSTSGAAVARVEQSLELAASGERDALILALGRSRFGSGALGGLVSTGSEDDRRSVATVLGAAATSERHALLTTLLSDSDATVRAQAAWSAGAFPPALVRERLLQLVKSGDADAATNAIASLARAGAVPASYFCASLQDPRPFVRVNALAALGRANATCASEVRARLKTDTSVDVRAAAARWLTSQPDREAREALARCVNSERSARVARACQQRPLPHLGAAPRPVEVFVVPYGATGPKPYSQYVLELGDGFVRAGTTDRRGALFEPTATGELALRRPEGPPVAQDRK